MRIFIHRVDKYSVVYIHCKRGNIRLHGCIFRTPMVKICINTLEPFASKNLPLMNTMVNRLCLRKTFSSL